MSGFSLIRFFLKKLVLPLISFLFFALYHRDHDDIKIEKQTGNQSVWKATPVQGAFTFAHNDFAGRPHTSIL